MASPTIPVIDLTRPEGEVAAAIDAACGTIGFLQIVGHGLDVEVEAAAWEAARAFFRIPLADKLAVAIAGRDCERFSVAFFHNANWDAVIECLPTCCGPDRPPRYAPITAGTHLMEKFRSTQDAYFGAS